MKTILENAFEKGFTYTEYRNFANKLIEDGKVTGHEQSEDLLHYAQLNETRMIRLDKTIVITDEVQDFLKNIPNKMIWLVLTESWCGDAAQINPIINKMAMVSDNIDLRFVLRDDNPDLMNLFLNNGSKSIPKLIILDAETWNVIGDFGPRPQAAKQLILDYKAAHGIIDETAKIELQKWYLHDKGISTQKEIIALLS